MCKCKERKHCKCKDKKKPNKCNFTFDVLGDHIYDQAGKDRIQKLIHDVINVEKPKFVLHVGDYQTDPSGFGNPYPLSVAITKEQMVPFRDYFYQIKSPFLLTPGDNDWMDTIRNPTGPPPTGAPPGIPPYPPNEFPLQTLSDLRDIWFNEGFNKKPPFTVKTQAELESDKYGVFVENRLWTYRKLTFVTAHTSGTNNGLDPRSSAYPSAAQDVINEAANGIITGRIEGTSLFVDNLRSGTITVGQDISSPFTEEVLLEDSGRGPSADEPYIDYSIPITVVGGETIEVEFKKDEVFYEGVDSLYFYIEDLNITNPVQSSQYPLQNAPKEPIPEGSSFEREGLKFTHVVDGVPWSVEDLADTDPVSKSGSDPVGRRVIRCGLQEEFAGFSPGNNVAPYNRNVGRLRISSVDTNPNRTYNYTLKIRNSSEPNFDFFKVSKPKGVRIGTTILEEIVPNAEYRVSGPNQIVSSTEMHIGGRINANLSWLNRAFDLAESKNSKGMVIATHAFLNWEDPTTGFSAMGYLIHKRTRANPDMPVLFIYGSDHDFRVEKPLPSNEEYPPIDLTYAAGSLSNFTALKVPGSAVQYPLNRIGMEGRVKIDVDYDSPGLFKIYSSLDTL